MKYKELIAFDSSLLVIDCQGPEVVYQTLATLRDGIQNEAIYWVKNQKFHKQLLESDLLNQTNSWAIIYDKKLWEELSSSQARELERVKKGAACVMTSPHIALSMTRLSKPFFDIKNNHLNDEVDARQMGTAQIHPSARIAQGVFIGEGVKIGAGTKIHSSAVILAKSEIGENCEIFPNVTIYRFVKIAKGCRIHSHTTIGADGFGYTFDKGVHQKIWHIGGVEIGQDVEIGANTCIDQGTFSPTKIGDGCKIDNQVQIGHNCHLGKAVILCGQVGIAGSTTIEDYTVVGGGAGIGPDLVIGRESQIAGQAGVTGSCPAKSILAGHPARPVKEWLRSVAYLRKSAISKGD